MKLRLLAGLVFFTMMANIYAQSGHFVGKIVYEKTCEPLSTSIAKDQLIDLFGTKAILFFDGGNYRQDENAQDGWKTQWYDRRMGKGFYLKTGVDTLFEVDVSIPTNRIKEYSISKGKCKILGHLCDELTVIHESGISRYYYSDKFSSAADAFNTFKAANMDTIMRLMQAVTLKLEVKTENYILTYTAIKIKEMQRIPKRIMRLPEKLPVQIRN
jgi:hypothetical protein